ncbi:MAG: hypothetical protein N4A42_02000 [Winogradskyella sp.]|nr:hypothetical protein [Winogradskyella sp.]
MAKRIVILIFFIGLIFFVDYIFSKKEYSNGILIRKIYSDKLIPYGNNRNGHNIRSTRRVHDPNGYVFYISSALNNEIKITTNVDTYTFSHEGDSVYYSVLRGCIFNRIYKSSIIKMVINKENRKKFRDRNLSPFEKLLKDNKNRN